MALEQAGVRHVHPSAPCVCYPTACPQNRQEAAPDRRIGPSVRTPATHGYHEVRAPALAAANRQFVSSGPLDPNEIMYDLACRLAQPARDTSTIYEPRSQARQDADGKRGRVG